MLLYRLDRNCAGAKPFRLNPNRHANNYRNTHAHSDHDSADLNRNSDKYTHVHSDADHDRNQYDYTHSLYPAHFHFHRFGDAHSIPDSLSHSFADPEPDKHPDEYTRAGRYNDGYDHTVPINDGYPSLSEIADLCFRSFRL